MSHKYRIRYEKARAIRMLAHLEVARVLERACRRSGLPVSMSQGFRPHQKITFATNLPVGVASEVEYVDIGLDEPLTPEAFRDRLTKALPAGMSVSGAVHLPDGTPALQSQNIISTFILHDAPMGSEELLQGIRGSDVIEITRKKGPKQLESPGRYLTSISRIVGENSTDTSDVQVELVTLAAGGGLGIKDLLSALRELPGGSGVWAKRVGLAILEDEMRKDPLDVKMSR